MKAKSFVWRTVSFALVAGVLSGAASAADVVYLKPLAAEETRAVQDGTTWATAYADAAEALAAANGAKPVYAAGGYYLFGSTTGFSPVDGATLYGGFAGVSEAETPEGRDLAAHPTIFSGDAEQDDVWQHLEPEETGGKAVQTTLKNTVLLNGALNPPPAFSGDYDSYIPIVKGAKTKRAFLVPENVGVTIDGVTFTGYNGVDGAAFTFAGKSKDSTVRNCRFFGNTGASGTITHNAGGYLYIDDCRFEFCTTTSRGSAVQARDKTVMRRCTFLSCSRLTNNGGNVVYFWSGTGSAVIDSTFCRCFSAAGGSWEELNYGGAGNICSAEASSNCWMENCVITNCYTASAYSWGVALLSPGPGFRFSGCRIENNFSRVKPISGRGYVLVGVTSSSRNFTVNNTVFKGNVIEAPVLGADGVMSYALGIVGNATDSVGFSAVGCVFDSNTVRGVQPADGYAVFSRGVLTSGTVANSTAQGGVLNCTFTGPAVAGVVDAAQFGKGHSKPFNIVNSIFEVTDADEAKPFHFDVPGLVHVYSSSVKNMIVTPTDYDVTGLACDAVPMTDYVPTVRVPQIRTTADVSTNNTALPVTFAFRPNGSTAWQALCPQIGGLTGKRGVISDAKGAVRTEGAVTRGAYQAMSALAEDATAHALVLRRNPLAGGSFSAPGSAQMVAAGASSAPVTVSVSDPDAFSFDGWYDEGGTKVSGESTLSFASLDADTVVTARFLSPVRTVTYELGDYGTFVADGKGTAAVTVHYGDPFPQPPAFRDASAWHVTGWDRAFPATMPNEDVTIRATAVTKDLRIIYLVPEDEAPADGDGTSWAKAYGNFSVAFADAAQYRGEVRVKTGLHVIRSETDLKSNVRIIGGFAGTETSADEADPAKYPTVFTGDVKGDNYWKPQNADPGAAYRTNVVKGLAFTEQLVAADAEKYWCCGGNNSDDALFLLIGREAVTNIVLRGVSLTGFRNAVILATHGIQGLSVENCRFVANNTAQNYTQAALMLGGASTFAIRNSTFYGNWRSVHSDSTTLSTNLVSDCLFDRNYANGYGASLRVSGKGFVTATNCTFRGNTSPSESFRNASCLSVSMSVNTGRTRLVDCLIEGNHAFSTSYGCVVTEGANTEVEILRCRFRRNLGSLTDHTVQSPCLCTKGGSILLVRDSYFADNHLRTAGTKNHFGSVAALESVRTTFLNCTFERNTVANSATGGRYGTFVSSGGHLGLVNCLVTDSVLGAGAAEFAENATADANRTFALVNTVVSNASDGYVPFDFPEKLTPGLASSAVSGFDATKIATGNNGYVYDMTDAVPVFNALEEKDGALARRISGSSPLARGGRPVWLGTDGHVYFYDATNPAVGPWRRAADKTVHLAANAVSPYGVSLEAGLAADAFGAARNRKRISRGPLNANAPGLLLLVR